MRGCARPATRCNPGLAVGPRASSGPAPAAASRGRPPPGTVSDLPWFPHPSPFVWLFCKTNREIATISNDGDRARTFEDTQASQAKSRILPGISQIYWYSTAQPRFIFMYMSAFYVRLISTLSESKLIGWERYFLIVDSRHRKNSRKRLKEGNLIDLTSRISYSEKNHVNIRLNARRKSYYSIIVIFIYIHTRML